MDQFKGGFSYDLSVPGQVDLYDFPPQPVSPLPVKKMELDELRYDQPKRPSSPPAGAVDRDVGDTGFLALLYQFGDTVSAAGLPRVFTERSSLWSRLIYAIVFVASFGTGVYFSVKIVQEFLEYPVIVTTAFTAESRMDFPSVTICNTNRVRYSAIIESKHSDLEYLLTDRSLGGLYYPPCLEDDMLCDTNECLRRFKVCDGIRDCDDGEDEVNCYYGDCGYRQHRCETGGDHGYCINHNDYVCNGEQDCYDNSDESDCDDGDCLGFRCTNSSDCISQTEVCDGTYDCSDGSDELNCTSAFTCMTGMVKCATIDYCIYPSWVCDNYADCSDRSDEAPLATCSSSSAARKRRSSSSGVSPTSSSGCYWCSAKYGSDNTTLQCFPLWYECDGYEDCVGGTDESNCDNINYHCPDNFFACTDGECIHEQFECDGWDDCTSGSDEDNCEEPTRSSNSSTISDLFQDGWYSKYLHITDEEWFYEDFEDNYLQEKYNVGFERVSSEDPPDWHGFATFSATGDYTDLEDVVKLTKAEMADLGHQNEDFILQCTFDQTKCHYEDFEVIQDDKYGNCFTWNHHSRNMSLRSTGPGSTHGLKLTLFTEQSEYISIYGQDSGVRVSIHEMGTTPFPEDDGFTVAPGKATGVGLKQLIINREDPPHGECSNSTSFESMYGDGYSVAACRKQCLQDYMERECGCVDTIMISDVPRCRILNQTQEICRQLMYYMLQNNMLECECALPCSEIIYLKTISQSLWPSVTYLYHLLKTIHSINDKTKDINDFEQAQSNLVRLEVYFEEMTYETMSETPKYEGVYNLLAEIGGVIGIYVGLSFITVVEFVEFFVAVVRYLFRRIKRSMKVEALK